MRKLSITLFLSIMLLLFSGCAPLSEGDSGEQPQKPINIKATIDVIDVGSGECSLITLPDGKTLLIDAGAKDDKVYQKIKEVFEGRGVEKIDYFILTHPDLEHIGNARNILADYEVGVLYHSKIAEHQLKTFAEFSSILSLAGEKGVTLKTSEFLQGIFGEEYSILFLSPSQSYFGEVGGQVLPSESMVEEFSPIIYLDILGRRAVFTGDAGRGTEEFVLSN